MPFADAGRPSIQLGLLKALGEACGFPVSSLHASLDLATRIGLADYRALSAHRGWMLGDWLFSVAAFGDAAPDPEARLLDDVDADLSFLTGSPAEARNRLLEIRQREIPAFLDRLVDTVDWDAVRVIGFTSTFQQNAASIALARRLKEHHPELVTVFGGANFDGEMGLEYLRTIECIDFAVIGEGDLAFPRLLCALADGNDPGTIAGVARKDDGRVVATPPGPPVRQLDQLPLPDYGEYFTRSEQLGLLPGDTARTVWIPFEGARGCWWGAKHHCTFCGLNRSTMEFRAKSPQRVLDELAEQARRYRSFRFEAVDNIIDMGYLKTLLPAIVDSAADYDLFYEVKANLTRAQLKLMAQAGVRSVQPGLESLSSRVLQLMRKGTRAAQNINLLRWARYYGIDVAWNILWGFPGETERDYADQAALVPQLLHLQPPESADRIWLERFSPMFADRDNFALRTRTPEMSYRYVYPDSVDLDQAAYFFEYDPADALPDEAYDALRKQVNEWRQVWQDGDPPTLTYRAAPGLVQIYDRRPNGRQGTHTFRDPLAAIFLACSNRPASAAAVRDRLHPLDLPERAIKEIFGEFRRRGLMFIDGSLAVALPIPAVTGR